MGNNKGTTLYVQDYSERNTVSGLLDVDDRVMSEKLLPPLRLQQQPLQTSSSQYKFSFAVRLLNKPKRIRKGSKSMNRRTR